MPSAGASSAVGVAQEFLARINDAVLFPLIVLLLGIAFTFFLYGAFEYVAGANNPQMRQQGQRHLLFGILGLVVMVSAYGILLLAAGTFGISVG